MDAKPCVFALPLALERYVSRPYPVSADCAENRGDWIRTCDLLLPKQVNTLTNYYILPDSRGKPGVGAEVS
jgi:hypothetical protein